ncbi:MAG: dienelactone hydrolase family protein [Gammaproteobacteria bacterium]|nr:dienelactone hydrolase family protein [Gammaproteobacteria bacterium]
MSVRKTDVKIPLADGAIGCYLVEPEHATAGVVVVQEIFGVNRHIRLIAERLAAAGYAVLAPDIFHRLEGGVQLDYDEAGFDRGFELLRGLDRQQAVNDINGCLEFLRQRTGGKAGLIGFCLGGQLAFLNAARSSPDAVVAYYPGGVGNFAGQCDTVSCPIQFHFADRDDFVPADHVQKIRDASTELKQCEIYTYDAEHGFNCDARSTYDPAAADLAWQRTTRFLADHLKQ